MKRVAWTAAGIAALALAAAAPAGAHHSFAMFDFSRTLVLKGTVQTFQWTNPHVLIWVDTPGGEGVKPGLWSAELTSPGNLTRRGWSKRTLAAGMKVEVTVNPLRSGEKGGGFRSVKLVDTGEVLTASPAAAQGRPAVP